MIPRTKIRGALRKLWLWSPMRRDAMKRAKVAPKAYLCEDCRRLTPDPEVDHLEPVGATPGARGADLATWDGLITRLFCSPDGLRVLCKSCHLERRSA